MIQCKIKDDESESLHINVTVQPSWSFTPKEETTSKQISASGRYRVKFIDAHTSHLMITNADMSDAGSYECRAIANGRELKKSVSVTIYKSIELIDIQANQHPIEGDTAQIYCRAKADPVPEINWFRKQRSSAEETEDTDKVVDTVTSDKFSTEENGQILVIRNFDTSTDNGMYKCSVNQVESGDMKDLTINVTGYVKPQIKHVSEDPEFNEGASGDIFCAASGVPAPHFNWFKRLAENGLAIQEGEEYLFPEPGLLRILKATKEDSGIFVCEVFNAVAKDRKNVSVKIFHLPTVVEAANVTIKREESAQLDCAYTGGEPLTARWHSKHGEIPVVSSTDKEDPDDQDMSRVHEHNRYTTVDGNRKIITLHIKNTSMDDGGEYQCRVSNKAGNATKAAYVLIENYISGPGLVKPVRPGPGQIWSPVDHCLWGRIAQCLSIWLTSLCVF
uniref:Ig-like domain-containing protein n=1 Tax=Romanomermis culicivorax TaxID=13658 RepID=A0A915I176_ROMCU